MPLGFARSTFVHKAAAAAAPDQGFFQSSGTTSDGANGAGIVFSASGNYDFETNDVIVVSVWFKGTSSDFPSGGVGALAKYAPLSGGEGFQIRIKTNGIQMLAQDESYGTEERSYSPAGWSTNYLDDNWHHVVMKMSKIASNAQLFVDGSSVTLSGSTGTVTGTFAADDKVYHNSNPTADNPSGYYDAHSTTLEYAQLFISTEDIDLSTDIAKFYNSGYVDMGTDGTDSGLNQPIIFLHQNTGTFPTNGGSDGTAAVVSEGSGGYTTSSSGGPS